MVAKRFRGANVSPTFHWDDDWRKRRLMDWLMTPIADRQPRTKTELAELFGVDVRTMRQWHDHPSFRKEWELRVADVIGDPSRAQNVIDVLYKAAIDANNRNHVQAAKLYLEATNAIKPPPIQLELKRPADMTEAELDELLAAGAAQLQAEREKASANEVSQVDATD